MAPEVCELSGRMGPLDRLHMALGHLAADARILFKSEVRHDTDMLQYACVLRFSHAARLEAATAERRGTTSQM